MHVREMPRNFVLLRKIGKGLEEAWELTLLHSERPKLYASLAFLSAVGLKNF